MIEELRAVQSSIATVSESMNEVADAIRADIAHELKRARVVQLPALALLLVIGVVALLNLSVIKEIRQATDATRNSTELIIDCTTVGGECYRRGTSSTGGRIAQLETNADTRAAQLADCIRATGPCPTIPTPTTTTTLLPPDPATP
jgi:hypothetical protein